MKAVNRTLLLFAFLLIFSQVNAQTATYFEETAAPQFYLGLGTGINSYTALLGISGNYRVAEKLFIEGGLGIGMWGYKTSIGLRYHRNLLKGLTYGFSFASCSGLKEFTTEMEVQSGAIEEVTMDLSRANTLNLKTGYFWTLGTSNTFYIDAGYSFALNNQPYKVQDGSALSSTSIAVMEILSPGGILLGLGFTFGL
jgi:hypothetical protein